MTTTTPSPSAFTIVTRLTTTSSLPRSRWHLFPSISCCQFLFTHLSLSLSSLLSSPSDHRTLLRCGVASQSYRNCLEMAFCGKLGGLIRQSVSASNMSNGAPAMHLLNSARYMSSKLFVGGLSYGTDDLSLKEAFNSFGNVTEARVITDRETGRSRGFGFVNFDSDESASSAMSAMDGQELQGRNIRVSYANERPSGGFRGGFGGGNSGYGGNSGGGY